MTSIQVGFYAGAAAPGAVISVFTDAAMFHLANLYTDTVSGVSAANPITADPDTGDFAFFAAAGNYYLSSVAGDEQPVLSEVTIRGTLAGGNVALRAFGFDYTTPHLSTGARLFVPAVGDFILNMWMSIFEPWDGTTPQGDILVAGPAYGLLTHGESGLPGIDMTVSDTDFVSSWESSVPNAPPGFSVGLGFPVGAVPNFWPARITTPEPISVVVSQDGTPTGGDPGSTQGAASLFLLTATAE